MPRGFCPDLQGNIVTHASITARPFFERREYNQDLIQFRLIIERKIQMLMKWI